MPSLLKNVANKLKLKSSAICLDESSVHGENKTPDLPRTAIFLVAMAVLALPGEPSQLGVPRRSFLQIIQPCDEQKAVIR